MRKFWVSAEGAVKHDDTSGGVKRSTKQEVTSMNADKEAQAGVSPRRRLVCRGLRYVTRPEEGPYQAPGDTIFFFSYPILFSMIA